MNFIVASLVVAPSKRRVYQSVGAEPSFSTSAVKSRSVGGVFTLDQSPQRLPGPRQNRRAMGGQDDLDRQVEHRLERATQVHQLVRARKPGGGAGVEARSQFAVP